MRGPLQASLQEHAGGTAPNCYDEEKLKDLVGLLILCDSLVATKLLTYYIMKYENDTLRHLIFEELCSAT